MRIATNSVSEGIVRQIQLLSSQQAKLQTEVSTGQTINQPEDAPAMVGRVLNQQSELRQITQYGNNASTALEIAQASASGLQSVKAISDRAGELVTLGTGVLGAGASQSYATETNQLIEQAVQDANSQLNGNYLFAGTASASPPIVATRDANGQITSVSYAGNAAQAAIPLSEATSVTPSTTGTTNSGLADFINNLISLRNALTSGDTAAVSATQPGLTTSENLLVSAIADNGGVQTRVEASQTDQSNRTTAVNQLISSETSADMPSTIVQLNQTQVAYQAALQSAANIMKLSLLNYIQ